MAMTLFSKFNKLISSTYAKELVNTVPRHHEEVSPHNKKYWPHQFVAEWTKVHAMEQWCYKNFKGKHWRSTGRFFAFKRQKDYEWFILMWM